MAVAYVRHVVVSVQIPPALFVEQILHPPSNDLDRLSVCDAQVLADVFATSRERFSFVRSPRRKTVFRYAENQIRVRRKAPPDVALARAADAGKIAIPTEQVGDDLKVQVRRPPAIFTGRAQARDLFAFRGRLAGAQAFERFRAQMAVERVERAIIRGSVFQDDHMSVIERRGVDGEVMNFAVNRREDRRAGFGEKIDAQMNRALFIGQSASGREQRRGVKQPRLIVTSDANLHAGRAHRAEDALGQFRLRVFPRGAAEERAADAQIQNEPRRGAQTLAQNRRERPRLDLQPLDHMSRVRRRRQTAGVADDGFREARRYFGELRQRVSNGLLADREVIVAGPLLSLMRAYTDAHTQPQAREAEQRGHLVFG